MGLRILASAVVVAACGRVGFDVRTDAGTLAPPSCHDAILNDDETGIDCGGSCLPCVGATCSDASACATGSCINGQCELASGPPFWLPGPPLATARLEVGCATDVTGAIIVAGGCDGSVAFATTEELAAFTSAFVPGPMMQAVRKQHAVAATADGTVWAYGGRTSTGVALSSLEVLAGGAWLSRTASPTLHAQIGAAGGLDGNLYVLDTDGLWIYTPATDSWTTAAVPAYPRDDNGMARGTDQRIYAVGGRGTNNGLVDVDAWDGTMGAWLSRAPLHAARFDPATAAALDGRIYAVGGTPDSTTVLASVEAYVPERDRWIDVPAIMSARTSACAAVGGDGRLYVAGGDSGGAVPMASVEVYGPVITLSAQSAASGTTVSVAGSNFAANAGIAISFDGTPLAVGTTDATGSVSLDFVVPAATSGGHHVTGLDDRSQFPTTAALTVP